LANDLRVSVTCTIAIIIVINMLKNRNDPEMGEPDFHARLSHSKQLLKNIHPMVLASFCALMKIFTVTTRKNLQNDRLYAYPSTKKKDVMTKCLHTH